MHILVTNDDGIHAPGLLALANAMHPYGDVTILAPDRNWSGGGHVKTLNRPLRVRQVTLADGSTGYTSDGAPSDCVALAVMGFFEHKFDLVVSGINPVPNLGHDVTYSGTVTATMEGIIWGVPGIAISLDGTQHDERELDFAPAAHIAQLIVQNVQKRGLPKGIFLNVNVPDLPLEAIRGIQYTRQGLRVYRDRLETRLDPRGNAYYWIGGDKPTGVPEKGSDVGALADGCVSVTPLQLDLTAYPALAGFHKWDIDLVPPQQDTAVAPPNVMALIPAFG